MSPKPKSPAESAALDNLEVDREEIEHDEKSTVKEKNIDTTESAYDEVLPKSDPAYMAPIRRWEKRVGFVTPVRWISSIAITLFHVLTVVYFSYLIIFHLERFSWKTILFGILMGHLGGFGVTGGAHRLWSHKAYKAKLPLKIILLICYSIAGQNNLYNWVRDHRVHHKHSETAADPHDANRGFFFSHVGWLMMKKHPAVLRAGANTDMSDIVNDPLLRFHSKYFNVFKILFCFVIPTMIPVYCWNEDWDISFVSQSMVRYMCSLNFTWSVNSFAHLWGHKPYDENIMPSENWGVSLLAMGEGWHNYHHTFPWDYKAAELPYSTNTTTVLLDMFAALGWVYDRKKASNSLIKSVVKNRANTPLHSKKHM